MRQLSLAVLLLGMGWAQQAQSSAADAVGPQQMITEAVNLRDLVSLRGNTRAEARDPANDRGAVADSTKFEDLILVLQRSPAQEKALDELMDEQVRGGNPNYHKWLTARDFGARYGASDKDIATISAWLQGQGFAVKGAYPSHMALVFSGSALQIRSSFHTEIHNLDVGGKAHVANMSDPMIPAALAPVVAGLIGLNNFRPDIYVEKQIQPDLGPEYTFSSNGTNYWVAPGDFATIYNLSALYGAGYTGKGQTIAVFEDSDYYRASDWTTFRKTFLDTSLYPDAALHKIQPTGANSCTDPGAVDGTEVEVEIDMEYASAVAPDATIDVIACADSGDTASSFGGLLALENEVNTVGAPTVWSLSYGASETNLGASVNLLYNNTYQQAASQGISVFVSAGDTGPAVSDYNGAAYAEAGVSVNGLASSPYNVAVGGTDFEDYYLAHEGGPAQTTYWNSTNGAYYESAKSYIPETPWNDSCASELLITLHGYTAGYGTDGFCNSTLGQTAKFLTTAAGSGGPSGCYTGAPAVTFNGQQHYAESPVSGTCAGQPKPSWQSGLYGNPADGVRDVPDVSLFSADGAFTHTYPFCDTDVDDIGENAYCGSAPSDWLMAGGTSFAAPEMAAIQALINQAIDATTGSGNPDPVYYTIANTEFGASGSSACNSSASGGPASTCVFYDVTAGDNDVPCHQGGSPAVSYDCYLPSSLNGVMSTSTTAFADAYAATSGYDMATGIGTVNAGNLANAWTPAAPTNLSATASDGQVTLSFTAGVRAKSFNVYQGTGAGAESTTPVATGLSGSPTTITGLTDGTTYYFEVAGVDVGGPGALSNEVSATPLAPVGPPAGITITAGNDSVTLSWQPVSGAATYDIYQVGPGGVLTLVVSGIGGASYTLSMVPGGVSDTYELASVNADGGIGALSGPNTATPDLVTVAMTVNTSVDDSGMHDGLCSLRKAMANAVSRSDTTDGDCPVGGDVNNIGFSVSGTITLGSSLPAVTSSTVSISGAGQKLVISGNSSVVPFSLSGGTLSLDRLMIENGLASDSGGAVLASGGSLIVTSSSFSGNRAASVGGAILLNGATASIANSSFTGNSAGVDGGAIENEGAINNKSSDLATIVNSTFTGNEANFLNRGGAIAGGPYTLANTLLAGNKSQNLLKECRVAPTLTDNGGNLDDDGSCGFSSTNPASYSDDPNPGLDPSGLQDNGGPTLTVGLVAGSDAIDHAGSAICAAAPVSGFDQRGVSRPQGTGCDIGAFEYQPAPIIGTATAGTDSITVNWTDVAGAASYDIYEVGPGGVLTLVASGVTGSSYTVTGLNPSVAGYQFEVAGVDAGSVGADSAASTAVSPNPVTAYSVACTGVQATDAAALSNAIDSANAQGGSNQLITITLTAGCAYTFNAADEVGDTSSAESRFYWYGPSALPAIAAQVSIVGNGATIATTGESASNHFRLFYVGPANGTGGPNDAYITPAPSGVTPTLTLENLTLSGGLAEGGAAVNSGGGLGAGGAIFNQGALVLNAVTLDNNEALGGSSSGTGVTGGGGIGTDGQGNGGGGFGPGSFGGTTPSGSGGQGFKPGDLNSDPSDGGGAESGLAGDGNSLGGDGSGGGSGGPNSAPSSGGAFGGGANAAIGGGGVGGGGGANGGVGGGGGFGGGGGGGGLGTGGGGFGGGGGSGVFGSGGVDSFGGFGGGKGSPGASGGGGGGGLGGAIFNMQGTVSITNSTLIGNTAAGGSGFQSGSGLGGAVFNLSGTVTVLYSSLAYNTADNGGAIYTLGYDSATARSASTTLDSSIATGSVNSGNSPVDDIVADAPATTAAGTTNMSSASVDESDDNLVSSSEVVPGDGGTVTGTPTSDTTLGLAAALSANGAGNSPQTLALLSGSPAIDAGDSSKCPATDERGVSRPQGSGCDIGAFEYQPAPIISGTGSNDSITLNWTAEAGATGYDVYLVGPGGSMTLVASGITGTSVTLSNLSSGTAYEYVVAAVNGGIMSGDSNAVTLTPISFASVSGATAGSTVSSTNSLTLTSNQAPATISIDAGYFCINSLPCSNIATSVQPGDTVSVQLNAPLVSGTSATANLVIGDVSGSFTVTTQ